MKVYSGPVRVRGDRGEQRWNAIAETEVCRRWWRYMREIRPSSADDSPVASELKEVFRL
jgi:L-rhamnose mutarotase